MALHSAYGGGKNTHRNSPEIITLKVTTVSTRQSAKAEIYLYFDEWLPIICAKVTSAKIEII